MTHKLCIRCLETKPKSEFGVYKRNLDGLQNFCLQCKRRYDRLRYQETKNSNLCKKKLSNKKAVEKRKTIINELKSVPCKDCGIKYNSWQMHFDHLRDKKFNIGALGRHIKLEIVLEEIKKCDVVCANCHANRTYNRLQSSIGKA